MAFGKTILRFITIVAILGSGLACTRKANIDSSAVTLTFAPQKEAKDLVRSDATLQRLMLNVSGADFATQLQIWARSDSANSITPPTSFSATIPQGSNRLVQVLAIYVDPTTGQFYLYYNDVTFDLNTSTKEVDITLLPMPGSNGQGLIGGRYINADQTGPTGKVNMFYSIPGKPAMLVDSTEIFNGWFNFTVLQGGSFTYRLLDGTPLFQNINALSPTLGSTDPAKVASWMNVYIPPYYNQNDDGTRTLQSSQRWNVGFFGPGTTATNQICYNGSDTTSTDRLMDDSSTAFWPWIGSKAPVDDGSLSSEAGVEPVNGLRGGTEIGGTAGTVGAMGTVGIGTPTAPTPTVCGATLFSDYFNFNSASLSQDSALGFRGPFQPLLKQTYLSSSIGADGRVALNWKYLPNPGVDGVVIFSRATSGPANSRDYKANDGFMCANMPAGFIASALIPVSTATASLGPESFGLNSVADVISAYNSQRMEVVLCPYSAATKTYYTSGLDMQNVTPQQYFLTWSAHQASNLGSILASANSQYTYNVDGQSADFCKEYDVAVVDAFGNPVTYLGDISVQVNSGGTPSDNPSPANYATTYNDASCTYFVNGSSNFSIAAGSSSTSLWLKDEGGNTNGVFSEQVTASTSSGISITPLSAPMAFVSAADAATSIQQILPKESMFVGQCYQVIYATTDGSFNPLSASSDVSFTPSFMGSGVFYSDSNCTTYFTGPNLTITANSSLASVYFKPSAAGTVNFSGFAMGSVQFGQSTLINVGDLNVVGLNFLVDGPQYNINTCMAVYANFVDSSGLVIADTLTTAVTGTLSISTKPSSAHLYQDNQCQNAIPDSNSFTLPVGYSGSPLFYYQYANWSSVTGTILLESPNDGLATNHFENW